MMGLWWRGLNLKSVQEVSKLLLAQLIFGQPQAHNRLTLKMVGRDGFEPSKV